MKKPHFENQPSVDALSTFVLKGSDDAIWPAFEDGSKEAFEKTYKAHIQSLIQYGYKITSERSLIHDCIQDLFVELWQNRSSLGQIRLMKHYLLKSLRYKLIRALQKNHLARTPESD